MQRSGRDRYYEDVFHQVAVAPSFFSTLLHVPSVTPSLLFSAHITHHHFLSFHDTLNYRTVPSDSSTAMSAHQGRPPGGRTAEHYLREDNWERAQHYPYDCPKIHCTSSTDRCRSAICTKRLQYYRTVWNVSLIMISNEGEGVRNEIKAFINENLSTWPDAPRYAGLPIIA